MKKSPSRKEMRMKARINRKLAGRKRAKHNEWLQKKALRKHKKRAA